MNAAWLKKTLVGKWVRFPGGGTKFYNADGSYAYKEGSGTFEAPGYRVHNSGLRCIDYPSPRFDLYVVRDNTLVLINGGGNRIEGRILK